MFLLAFFQLFLGAAQLVKQRCLLQLKTLQLLF
ncbi:hypothetical protein PI125_g14095 [Phytophthora idaei]|nr:hypothetical protein PI125_g14095 [Phytophthora idaei]